MLTRRETTGLLLASAAGAAVPGLGVAQEDWAAKLERMLTSAVAPASGTRFSILRFEHSRLQGSSAFSAVVGMDWQAGYRQRLFEARGAGEVAQFEALVRDILKTFQSANRDAIVA